jgi:hypothetical protein
MMAEKGRSPVFEAPGIVHTSAMIVDWARHSDEVAVIRVLKL